MVGGIYLRRGQELIEMKQTRYATEIELQALLAEHPDLLSGDGASHRWLLISREFGVASEEDGSDRWSVDHLFVDDEGVPTLVEVKRSTDTRIRREVVGQMLDYAANAMSYWQLEIMRARFETACAGDDPDEVLATTLGVDDADLFWERVGTNLAAGRLRLIFVADVIPNELRAIVEFLNTQMSPADVLAVEVRQYVDESGEHQTLVPKLIGATQAARRSKGRAERASWDEASWLDAFRESNGNAETVLVERLLEWSKNHESGLTIKYGSGAKNPGLKILWNGHGILELARSWKGGRISVLFGTLKGLEPFTALERRRELRAQLQVIPGIVFDDKQLELWPSFPIAAIASDADYSRFVAGAEWMIAELSRSAISSAFAG